MAFEKLNRDSEDSNIAFTKTSVLMRILVTTFVESVICVILATAAIWSTRVSSTPVSLWSSSAISTPWSGPLWLWPI